MLPGQLGLITYTDENWSWAFQIAEVSLMATEVGFWEFGFFSPWMKPET